MTEPDGEQHELIDRLLEAVGSTTEEDWFSLAFPVVFAIGGSELGSVVPDHGSEPEPGTMGAVLRKTHRAASREGYYRLIRERLVGMCDSGVREDFLVHALRDEVTRHVQQLAQTEGADLRREQTRASLEEDAASPERIASYRKSLAKRDPVAASKTDKQLANELRELAGVLGPIPKEQAQQAWERASLWHTASADLVSDHAIAVWRDLYSNRVIQDHLNQ